MTSPRNIMNSGLYFNLYESPNILIVPTENLTKKTKLPDTSDVGTNFKAGTIERICTKDTTQSCKTSGISEFDNSGNVPMDIDSVEEALKHLHDVHTVPDISSSLHGITLPTNSGYTNKLYTHEITSKSFNTHKICKDTKCTVNEARKEHRLDDLKSDLIQQLAPKGLQQKTSNIIEPNNRLPINCTEIKVIHTNIHDLKKDSRKITKLAEKETSRSKSSCHRKRQHEDCNDNDSKKINLKQSKDFKAIAKSHNSKPNRDDCTSSSIQKLKETSKEQKYGYENIEQNNELSKDHTLSREQKDKKDFKAIAKSYNSKLNRDNCTSSSIHKLKETSKEHKYGYENIEQNNELSKDHTLPQEQKDKITAGSLERYLNYQRFLGNYYQNTSNKKKYENKNEEEPCVDNINVCKKRTSNISKPTKNKEDSVNVTSIVEGNKSAIERDKEKQDTKKKFNSYLDKASSKQPTNSNERKIKKDCHEKTGTIESVQKKEELKDKLRSYVVLVDKKKEKSKKKHGIDMEKNKKHYSYKKVSSDKKIGSSQCKKEELNDNSRYNHKLQKTDSNKKPRSNSERKKIKEDTLKEVDNMRKTALKRKRTDLEQAETLKFRKCELILSKMNLDSKQPTEKISTSQRNKYQPHNVLASCENEIDLRSKLTRNRISKSINKQTTSKQKVKKTRGIKLVININCQNQNSEDSDDDANENAEEIGNEITSPHQDLSFLDDFDIDGIVDSLNAGQRCQSPVHETNVSAPDLQIAKVYEDSFKRGPGTFKEKSQITDGHRPDLLLKNPETNKRVVTNVSRGQDYPQTSNVNIKEYNDDVYEVIDITDEGESNIFVEDDTSLVSVDRKQNTKQLTVSQTKSAEKSNRLLETSNKTIEKEPITYISDDSRDGTDITNIADVVITETEEAPLQTSTIIKDTVKTKYTIQELPNIETKTEYDKINVKIEYIEEANLSTEDVSKGLDILHLKKEIAETNIQPSINLKKEVDDMGYCPSINIKTEDDEISNNTSINIKSEIDDASVDPTTNMKKEGCDTHNAVLSINIKKEAHDAINDIFTSKEKEIIHITKTIKSENVPITVQSNVESIDNYTNLVNEMNLENTTTIESECASTSVESSVKSKNNDANLATEINMPSNDIFDAENVFNDVQTNVKSKDNATNLVDEFNRPNTETPKSEKVPIPVQPINEKENTVKEMIIQNININKSEKSRCSTRLYGHSAEHSEKTTKPETNSKTSPVIEKYKYKIPKHTTKQADISSNTRTPLDNSEIDSTKQNKLSTGDIRNKKDIQLKPTKTGVKSLSKVYINMMESRMLECIHKEFTVLDFIHSGYYSNIYKCKDADGKLYAIKALKSRFRSMGIYNDKMLTDLQKNSSKDKYFNLEMINNFNMNEEWCFLTEYYPKTLAEEVGKKKPMDIKTVQTLSKQLVEAVNTLTRNQIVHSDIKSAHVLLNSTNDRLRLCGFDRSDYHYNIRIIPSTGTVNYRAPEIILGYPADFKIDVWATALVMYEMASGNKLFPGLYNNDILYKQICTIGPIDLDMCEEGTLSHVHFFKMNFLRQVGPKHLICINEMPPINNKLRQGTYAGVFTHRKTPSQISDDFLKTEKLYKLLKQMLIIHPKYRLPIDSVASSEFFI